MRQYVEGTKDAQVLLDLLSVADANEIEPTAASIAGRSALYSDVSLQHASENLPFVYVLMEFASKYLPQATLLAGVKAGEFHQGHFNANSYNYLEVGFSEECTPTCTT